MEVLWNGNRYKVISRYSNMVIIHNPALGRKETIPITNVEFIGENSPPPLSKPEENGVTVTIGTPVANAVATFQRKQDKAESTETETAEGVGDTTTPLVSININTLTLDGIASAARKIPGIGKVNLSRIVENRPAEGYSDMGHLKSVNSSLSTLRWSVLETYFTF